MINPNLVEIVCVIDRSGSMNSIREDAEGGFNSFIESLKKDIQDKQMRLTLTQFDSEIDFIYENTPFEKIEKYILKPRGMTALLDAMGSTIDRVGLRLFQEKEENRPGRIIFMTITDGQENSSKKFTKDKIREMIEHQESKYSWEFLFLTNDFNSFEEANLNKFSGVNNKGLYFCDTSTGFSGYSGISGYSCVSGYSEISGYSGVYKVFAENLCRCINTDSTFEIKDKEK